MSHNIPKIIHYCWFGGKPLPKSAKKCIASWRKYLPDYEIKEWNESNFDVNVIPYTSEAYKAGKYAFVSDYARFWILYNYGGMYFDTDVEVIRSLDKIIESGPFMGCESTCEEAKLRGAYMAVNPGNGLAAIAGMQEYEDILKLYSRLRFINQDGSLNLKTVVEYTTDMLIERGLKQTDEVQAVGGLTIYPVDYFCPIHGDARKLEVTENTVSIHHWAASWVSGWPKWRERIKQVLGPRITQWIIQCRK